MRTYEENLKTAEGLEKLRAAMQFVCGDQWEEVIAEQRPIIEKLMDAGGHNNALSAVMPVVKAMRADGKDPMLVLAVAAEIIYRQNKEAKSNQTA